MLIKKRKPTFNAKEFQKLFIQEHDDYTIVIKSVGNIRIIVVDGFDIAILYICQDGNITVNTTNRKYGVNKFSDTCENTKQVFTFLNKKISDAQTICSFKSEFDSNWQDFL